MKSSKRALKLVLLWLAKWLGLFRLARWTTRHSFAIVGWHGVSMGDEHLRFPQYFITPETLARRLGYLRRHYRIVSLSEALEQHASGKITPGQVVLTFDDGMYDLQTHGLPVLRRFDAPATVYVVSSNLAGRRQALSLAVRELLLTTRLGQVPATAAGDRRSPSLALPADRRRWSDHFAQRLAGLPAGDRQRQLYVRHLAEVLEVDWAAVVQSRQWDYLAAAELRDLADQGIDIQLHSHQHQTVVEMNGRLGDDTQTCRRLVEQVTGRAAADYCYPSGLWHRGCFAPLTQAGIRSAVTCKLGPNFARTPALALRRYIDHQQISQLEFESMVSGFRWLLHALWHRRQWFEPSEAWHEHGPNF